jgi:hypothetical protein
MMEVLLDPIKSSNTIEIRFLYLSVKSFLAENEIPNELNLLAKSDFFFSTRSTMRIVGS